MHPKVLILAEQYGVKLSDRVSLDVETGEPWKVLLVNDTYYNGRDISTRRQLWKDSESGHGHELLDVVNILDHDILHEIAHYVVASPEQRDLPEYGLGTVTYGAWLEEGRFPTWKNPNKYKCIPSVVSWDESNMQEIMAQILCIIWGKMYGISPNFFNYEVSSWDDYLYMKLQAEDPSPQKVKTALTRIKNLNVVPFNERNLLRGSRYNLLHILEP